MNDEPTAAYREEAQDCFKLMSSRVYRAMFRLTQGETCLSEDLVQEAFQAAWPKWSELRERTDDQRLTWLIRTATNKAIDVFRHNEVKREKEPDVRLRYQPPEPNVHQQALTSITIERFVQVIEHMPPQQARVAYLYWRWEYKNHEIAKLLGITPTRVTQHIKKAEATLQRELAPYAPIESNEPEGGA